MLRKIYPGLLLLCWLFSLAHAAPVFVEGKDYKRVKVTGTAPTSAKNKIQVLEFFSYGCPACNKLDGPLEVWLKKESNKIEFTRVPVTWHAEWVILAKAYYAADALHVSDKVTPAMFKAIHEDNQDMSKPEDILKVFQRFGVKKDDFESIFNFSPGIDAQINRGQDLMQQYGIVAIPSLIIANKYQTDIAMAGSPERAVQIATYLIKQEKS